jgi:hypothetical protein
LRGSSHAVALTSAISSGGEAARATRAFPVTQPLKTLVVKAFSPAADKLGHHLSRAPISTLLIPSAAYSTSLARWTSRCGRE